jgi:hypothetical protein
MPRSPQYAPLIAAIFASHYTAGEEQFEFEREELTNSAQALGVQLPKNLGDVIYSFRYRKDLPAEILSTAPRGKEWIIEPAGRSRYRFRLVTINRIVPAEALIPIKIPDATPEIISAYALNDEQALLAKVRYNRLIDLFLGIVAYPLQSHLRTSVRGMGQIEIDELYVGVGKNGQQFVVPVQAKGGSDQLSVVQTRQDSECCREKFPALACRCISAQFMAGDIIALFELALNEGSVGIVEERHYRLVPRDQITPDDLNTYMQR